MKSLASRLGNLIRLLQGYIQRPWYPPLLGLLAAADHFVIVIPTDGLLIAAILTAPKRWLSFFVWITLGSVLGGTILAGLIQFYGTPFLEWLSPGIHESTYWKITDSWVDTYGLWALFVVAALPIFQHPAIAITALAELPLPQIALSMLAGRIFKYGLFSWLASHTPRLLFRMKSVRKEMEEVAASEPHLAGPQTSSLADLTQSVEKRPGQ